MPNNDCKKIDELRPCPFCGNTTGDYHHEYAACFTCGAQTYKEKWNRRQIEDALRADIAALKHDMTKCPNCEVCIANLRDDKEKLQANLARKDEEIKVLEEWIHNSEKYINPPHDQDEDAVYLSLMDDARTKLAEIRKEK